MTLKELIVAEVALVHPLPTTIEELEDVLGRGRKHIQHTVGQLVRDGRLERRTDLSDGTTLLWLREAAS